MRWSERQRAMLRAMGIELFEREPTAAAAVATSPVALAARDAGASEPEPAPEPSARAATSSVAANVASALSPGHPELAAADWLVVGEPIDDEADPTGAQAQLLDNMLRAIGVARSAPGRAARATFLAVAERQAGAGGAGEQERMARVGAAVAAVRPGCIVALGRAAAQSLFATEEPLGALRGRSHLSVGVPVIVTCSLAFLLRHPEEKARAWADLCLAVRTLDEATAVASTAG